MNLDELQSVQNKERQSSSLQHLRASFYQEAGEFVQELRERRDAAAAEADDPFGSEEVRRLTDDMETAQRTVESLYERRVGKVVKMASIAAADMPYDEDGLTDEEEQLFETLVDRIKANRETVLSVLDGERGNLTCSRTEGETLAEDTPPGAGTPAEPDVRTSEPSPVDGGTGGDGRSPEPSTAAATGTGDDAPPAPPEGLDIGGAMGAEEGPGAGAPATPSDGSSETLSPSPTPGRTGAGAPEADDGGTQGSTADDEPGSVERRVVRITGEVGDIYGVDGRTYDLSSDDVVDLPEENASILVGQDNAEPLE